MRIDLHTHSTVSDGTEPPAVVVRRARDSGLDVVALTDHDSAAGWPEAAAEADAVGIGFVPGIEVSSRHGAASVHVLAYWPDPDEPALSAQLARMVRARAARLPRMLSRLQAAGLPVDLAAVHAQAGDAVALGRPHVADALVAAGLVADRGEAFTRWLAEGRPGYVSRLDELSTVDTIGVIRDAGGVPVLAHPWGRASRPALPPDVLADLAAAGLVGVEVDHQDHDAGTRAELRAVATELALVVTGASDYHGDGKVDHDLGCNTTAPEALAELEQARTDIAAVNAAG